MSRESSVTGRDFAIGALGVTAVILLATLLVVNSLSARPALALPQTGAAGDFLATTARLDETAEILLLMNTELGLLNAYGFNVFTGQIELIQQVDADRLTQDADRFRREQQERGRFVPKRQPQGRRGR